MRPHVSIVVTTYMHARFIRDAARSICDQEGVEVSVVLADNASPDGTKAIALAAFASRGLGDRVSTVDGQGAGWSEMFRDALGRIPSDTDAVALMSGDDCLAPEALASCARWLVDESYAVEPMCVTGMWRRVGEGLEVLGWFNATSKDRSGYYPAGDPLDAMVISGRAAFMQGVYRPQVAAVAADYLEGVEYADEIAVTAALVELRAHVVHVPVHFYKYRRHMQSANRTRSLEVLTDQIKVLDRLEQRTGCDVSAVRDSLRRELAARVGEAFELRLLRKRSIALRRSIDTLSNESNLGRRAPSLLSAFSAGAMRGVLRNVRHPGGRWRLPWKS